MTEHEAIGEQLKWKRNDRSNTNDSSNGSSSGDSL